MDEVVTWASQNNAGYTGLTLKGGSDMPRAMSLIGRPSSGVMHGPKWTD